MLNGKNEFKESQQRKTYFPFTELHNIYNIVLLFHQLREEGSLERSMHALVCWANDFVIFLYLLSLLADSRIIRSSVNCGKKQDDLS